MTNYEHTRVSRRHPQISIHLGGTIEAYCHCAASCYSATASNGCAASYRRPSAHHSDGFSTAVLPAAALATAVLHISSWLWTCRMTWFNQCHLEALKRPTNLKRWILQNIRGGMALMNYEHTTYCCPAHYCTVCRLLAALFMATAMPPMPGAASARFCVFPPISNSTGGDTAAPMPAVYGYHGYSIPKIASIFLWLQGAATGSGKSPLLTSSLFNSH